MSAPNRPPTANELRLSSALERNESIASLMQKVHASRARFALVESHLPAALLHCVRAGSLESDSWTLLVDHAAAAAKLRQLAPELQSVLASGGFAEPPLRIKVSPPR